MTVEEFILEEIERRTKAAAVLLEPLTINGIEIDAGCTEDGIGVQKGIEKIASLFNAVISAENKGNYKDRFITINGVQLRESRYVRAVAEDV